MSEDILDRPPPKATLRIAYGTEPSQFGDLFLPKTAGEHPVIIAIHGGFWRVQYDLRHLGHVCAALAREGFAVWSLEYRRIGEKGGEWPGLFADVATGAALLHEMAAGHHLDLKRVLTLGHSAGGQLALWLAARHKLPPDNPFQRIPRVEVKGVVGLAAVSDLAVAAQLQLSGGVAIDLLGGSPDEVPRRYAEASPAQLIPLGVRQRLVHGEEDDIVPFEMSQGYALAAHKAGDDAVLVPIKRAGHFELIDPESRTWPAVLGAAKELRDAGPSK